MLLSDFSDTIVKNYMYNNKSLIPILDTVKITNQLYGRLDIVLFKYYPNNIEYINLLYDFNNISNPLDVKIGMLIDIPDINYIISDITNLTILDDNIIPGVNTSMDSVVVNSDSTQNTESSTINIPKLNIEQKTVSYDTNTGQIKY